MLKIMSLLKRKEGMSREEFFDWATNQHPKLATKLPNIRGYRANAARLDEPEGAFDGVTEMWFDDLASSEAAFATEQGNRAREDAMAHASQRIHLHLEEKVFI